MPVSESKPAPYAPTTTILEVIERHRSRGLPKPINSDVLTRAGTPPTLIPRTLQTLQILDLIDADGTPTEIFENIRKAAEAQYQERLKEWLNSAYSDVIQYVDPEKDDEMKVRDAFRNYEPVGQQPRMVSLFLGLYAAAGVRTASAKKSGPTRSSPRQTAQSERLTPAMRKQQKVYDNSATSGIPEPLSGVLSKLPQEGSGWTQDKRDKFEKAFSQMLDFCFPIVEDDNNDDQQEAS